MATYTKEDFKKFLETFTDEDYTNWFMENIYQDKTPDQLLDELNESEELQNG